jgi:hypothetical protein
MVIAYIKGMEIKNMTINPDSTESKLLKGYYKTAYCPESEKFIGIIKSWITPKGELLVSGRFANDTHVYFFEYEDLTRFCF